MIPLPIVLTIGDDRRQEFSSIMAWLRHRASVICCRDAQQVSASAEDRSEPPVLVVWLQSFAGEFSHADCDAVAQNCPGVNMVCAYAAFAEGETRTGKPLPGVQRFPFHCWAGRIEPLWRVVCASSRAAGSVATRPASLAACRDTIRVGVYSGAREMKAVLGEALCILGYQVSPLDCAFDDSPDHATVPAVNPAGDFAVAIWEDSRDPRVQPLNVADFVSAVAPRPVIAISGFARWQDVQQLSACGVRRLLGKPFNLAELTHHLDELAAE